MIRTLYPYPGPVDFVLLLSELSAIDPDVVGCNDVGGQVAVYSNSVVDGGEIAAVVSAHSGPSEPAPDPLHLLAQAIVDATSLADLKPVAEQILGE